MEEIFKDLPALLSTEQIVSLTHISRHTIYDWQYRPAKYEIPEGMLVKFGRKLLIRKDVFKKWFEERKVG